MKNNTQVGIASVLSLAVILIAYSPLSAQQASPPSNSESGLDVPASGGSLYDVESSKGDLLGEGRAGDWSQDSTELRKTASAIYRAAIEDLEAGRTNDPETAYLWSNKIAASEAPLAAAKDHHQRMVELAEIVTRNHKRGATGSYAVLAARYYVTEAATRLGQEKENKRGSNPSLATAAPTSPIRAAEPGGPPARTSANQSAQRLPTGASHRYSRKLQLKAVPRDKLVKVIPQLSTGTDVTTGRNTEPHLLQLVGREMQTLEQTVKLLERFDELIFRLERGERPVGVTSDPDASGNISYRLNLKHIAAGDIIALIPLIPDSKGVEAAITDDSRGILVSGESKIAENILSIVKELDRTKLLIAPTAADVRTTRAGGEVWTGDSADRSKSAEALPPSQRSTFDGLAQQDAGDLRSAEKVSQRSASPLEGGSLQGVWELESGEADGKSISSDEPMKLIIDHTTMQRWLGKSREAEWTYSTEAANDRGYITLLKKGKGSGPKEVKGIYRLEDDRLSLVLNPKGSERPTDFVSEADSPNYLLMTFRRADASSSEAK
jgi:uncharacterized protein (TIGR03067 family)